MIDLATGFPGSGGTLVLYVLTLFGGLALLVLVPGVILSGQYRDRLIGASDPEGLGWVDAWWSAKAGLLLTPVLLFFLSELVLRAGLIERLPLGWVSVGGSLFVGVFMALLVWRGRRPLGSAGAREVAALDGVVFGTYVLLGTLAATWFGITEGFNEMLAVMALSVGAGLLTCSVAGVGGVSRAKLSPRSVALR